MWRVWWRARNKEAGEDEATEVDKRWRARLPGTTRDLGNRRFVTVMQLAFAPHLLHSTAALELAK